MQQIIGFIIRNGLRLLFLLLLGISLWLTISYHSFHRSRFVNSSNLITGYVYSKMTSVTDYFSLREENKRLYEENLLMKDFLLNHKQITDNNRLNLPTLPSREINVISSKIIENSYRKQKNFLTLRGGTKQGIRRDMGVINDKGIVGIIEHTSNNYATVLSVLSTDFQTVAKVKKNNQFGTLTWDGKSTGFVQLIDIARIESITKGDTIVTGFSSKAFPENIPIGTIDKITIDENSNTSTLHIRLFNDMTRVSYVYVVENIHKEEVQELKERTENNE